MIVIEQVDELLREQPGLSYDSSDNQIDGFIHINHTCFNEHVVADYKISIRIPKEYPDNLPEVFDVDNVVPKKFDHIFIGGRLCLGTEADQLLYLLDDHSFIEWFEAYVIPYFFAVEYFKKYGYNPFGDRSHGKDGILEYLVEAFKVESKTDAKRMLGYILFKDYRGHADCPCGSGKKLRKCHIDTIHYYQDEKRKRILQMEAYRIISEGERNYAESV